MDPKYLYFSPLIIIRNPSLIFVVECFNQITKATTTMRESTIHGNERKEEIVLTNRDEIHP